MALKPSAMKPVWEFLASILAGTVWFLLLKMPLKVTRGLLEGIGAVVGRLYRSRRRTAVENVRLAFPDWTDQQVGTVVDATFRNWGRLIAEVIHADELATQATIQRWEKEFATVDALMAEGRDVLVLTAHTGNYELLARLWGRSGRRVGVFHRDITIQPINDHLIELRRRENVESIVRGVGVRKALELLRDGVVIAVPLDQNQKVGKGVFVPLFGHLASTSTVLARLSLSTGAAVVPLFAVWEGGVTVPVAGPVIEPSGPGSPTEGMTDRSEMVLGLTERYTQEIEAVVRRYPEQWNWSHERWKTRPEAS